jgi:SAM-dependent methyltransferase
MTELLPLDLLACPSCRSDLHALEGALKCSRCEARAPVTRRVPDLLPASLRPEVEGHGRDRAWARWHDSMRAQARLAGTVPDSDTRALLDRAGVRGVVVDVGAGDGRTFSLLPPGARYVGVDPAATPATSLPAAACLVRGVVEALPLRDRVADAVVCLSAFDHFIDGPAALAEMARVLRPGGVLALQVGTVSTTVAHARGARSRMARVVGSLRAAREIGLSAGASLVGSALLERDHPHLHYYTRTQCLSMLAVRFEVDSVREHAGPTSTVLSIAARKRGTKFLPVMR